MPNVRYDISALAPVDPRAVLAYAGVRGEAAELSSLISECQAVLLPQLCPRVAYEIFPVTVAGNEVSFGSFSVVSAGLARHLAAATSAVIFVATLGIAPDRLIARYTPVSLAKACLADALGTERIEALCDRFCKDLAAREGKTTSRYSPGYGDLPLSFQRQIFSHLNPAQACGVTLNDSLLMAPSKSVSAIVGIR